MLVLDEWAPPMEEPFRAHLLINIEIRGRGDSVCVSVGKNIFRLPLAVCVSPTSDVLVLNIGSHRDDTRMEHVLGTDREHARGYCPSQLREEYVPPTVGHVCFADKRCAGFED